MLRNQSKKRKRFERRENMLPVGWLRLNIVLIAFFCSIKILFKLAAFVAPYKTTPKDEMVRTKQVRKKSSFVRRKTQSSVNKKTSSDDPIYNLVSKEYESRSNFIKEFNSFYENELEELKQSYEYACSYVKRVVEEKLQSLPDSFKLCNIHAIESNFQDQNQNPNTPSPPAVHHHRSRKSIESFDFKKPKTPRAPSGYVSRKRSASSSVASSSNTEKFKTPIMNNRMLGKGQTITPKIYSNTPMSVMRRPQVGEMAVSLTGSPLLVGSVTSEDVPTVNVPLMDGRVFSIIPQEGAPPPDLPNFDERTKEYLRTLQAHLALLAPRTP